MGTTSRSVRRPAAAAGPHRGTTLLELLVVLTIVAVAVGILSRIVVSTSRLRETNREGAVAMEAARTVLEEMRAWPLAEVYARYNADPADDPDGPGTAPGDRFAVDGLTPFDPAAGGRAGSVVFPAGAAPVSSGGIGGRSGLPGGASGGTSVAAPLVLREDVSLPLLGMPRDLNGDNIVDGEDHSADCLLLPVQVRVEWQGSNCPRSVDLFTMLTFFVRTQ
ncbi:MAG: prepilin-type N-terminal cleavage/methylation domain-containing protein [Planctomycetota bacterium]